MKENIKRHCNLFILLLLILAFFGKNLIPNDRSFIGGIDVENYFYWNAVFIKNQLLSGSLPLWNPYIGIGMPLDINTTFYPSTLLYLLLPIPWAFNLDTFLHILLAAFGMYYFVSALSYSKSAGIVSAIIYGLSGYMMDRIFAGHIIYIYSAALLPWILYFIEKSYQNKKPSFLIIAGLILGLQILTCDAQNSFYIVLALTSYYFFRFFLLSTSFNLKSFYRLGAYYLLIAIVSFGISAVQLLPYWEFISQTTHGKLTYESSTWYSFPIRYFFTFLVPRAETPFLKTIWEFGCYVGVPSLFLAIIGLLFSRQTKHKWNFGVLSLISLTILLGNQTPIYKFYYNFLPVITSMRAPCRAIILFIFTLAVFAGLGLQRLTENDFSKKNRIILIAIPVSGIAVIALSAMVLQISLSDKEILLAFGFSLSALIIILFNIFANKKSLIAALLSLLIFIDLTVIYKNYLPIISENNLLAKRSYERVFENDPGYYRALLPGHKLSKRRAIVFNFYDAGGFATCFLNDYYNFIHKMANLPIPPDFLRYAFSKDLFNSEAVFTSKILGIKYAIAANQNQSGFEMLMAKKIMPRALLVRKAKILPKNEHIDHIKKPDFDPEKEVLLESLPYDFETSCLEESNDRPNGIVSITKYEPNRIELSSSSDCNTFLVLSEIFYPGWHAYVDDEKVEILRANYLLRALPLPSGHHDIVFIYRPISFIIGAIISLFTLFFLIAIIFFNAKRSRIEKL